MAAILTKRWNRLRASLCIRRDARLVSPALASTISFTAALPSANPRIRLSEGRYAPRERSPGRYLPVVLDLEGVQPHQAVLNQAGKHLRLFAQMSELLQGDVADAQQASPTALVQRL